MMQTIRMKRCLLADLSRQKARTFGGFQTMQSAIRGKNSRIAAVSFSRKRSRSPRHDPDTENRFTGLLRWIARACPVQSRIYHRTIWTSFECTTSQPGGDTQHAVICTRLPVFSLGTPRHTAKGNPSAEILNKDHSLYGGV